MWKRHLNIFGNNYREFKISIGKDSLRAGCLFLFRGGISVPSNLSLYPGLVHFPIPQRIRSFFHFFKYVIFIFKQAIRGKCHAACCKVHTFISNFCSERGSRLPECRAVPIGVHVVVIIPVGTIQLTPLHRNPGWKRIVCRA